MVSTKMAVMYEHYDEAGWEHTQPGWYECSVRTEDIDKYDEMTQWLLNNIGKYKRHCRWCVTDVNVVSFKFRYERDYILFTLRWS
jgi:hypothetical protein